MQDRTSESSIVEVPTLSDDLSYEMSQLLQLRRCNLSVFPHRCLACPCFPDRNNKKGGSVFTQSRQGGDVLFSKEIPAYTPSFDDSGTSGRYQYDGSSDDVVTSTFLPLTTVSDIPFRVLVPKSFFRSKKSKAGEFRKIFFQHIVLKSMMFNHFPKECSTFFGCPFEGFEIHVNHTESRNETDPFVVVHQ